MNMTEKYQQQIKKLSQENKELLAKVTWYKSQILLMQKKKYASQSEKHHPDQLGFFNEVEEEMNPKAIEPKLETITYTRSKKSTKADSIKNLPIIEEHYELTEDECICNECGNQLDEMSTRKRDIIEIIPAQIYVRRQVQHIYSCRCCEKHGIKATIESAKMPTPLLKGSMASAKAVSYLISQKYMNAMPLYRQEKYFNNLGVNLSRQTMSNWIINSTKYFVPVYNRLKDCLLQQEVIHADETPVQVLKEEGRKASTKSYMWLYRTGISKKAIVLYDYQQSRQYVHPKNFLGAYHGYLQTDGYAAYGKIKNTVPVGCMAHVRRKFIEVLDSMPKDQQAKSLANEGLGYITKLYAIEKQIKDKSIDERYKKRRELSLPIFDEFELWVKRQAQYSLPKSNYGKAITYCVNQLHKVKNYLLDGRLEIDNNRAERSIKPFVIGRKNWLFSNTSRGAFSSALIYSLVETAKENNLRVTDYLEFLLNKLPDTNLEDIDAIDELLPWSCAAIESCQTRSHTTEIKKSSCQS